MTGLDYIIIEPTSGEFEIWTPDQTGAILGIGKTEREAKEDAIRNMEALCTHFYEN